MRQGETQPSNNQKKWRLLVCSRSTHVSQEEFERENCKLDYCKNKAPGLPVLFSVLRIERNVEHTTFNMNPLTGPFPDSLGANSLRL